MGPIKVLTKERDNERIKRLIHCIAQGTHYTLSRTRHIYSYKGLIYKIKDDRVEIWDRKTFT